MPSPEFYKNTGVCGNRAHRLTISTSRLFSPVHRDLKMKLFAIVACVAFLYGVSSETPDIDNNAEFEALSVVGDPDEWDETAVLALNEDQTDEGWDEGHSLAWMYGAQEQVSYPLESESDAQTERFSCSCSGGRCNCCLRFKIFFKRYNACLVASYRGGEICAAAKLNSRTLASRCVSASRTHVKACKRILRRKVCAGLTDITWGSRSVTARGLLEVKGIFSKKIGRITIGI
ncbi:uncharacterized protein LOC119738065 [Patiria miniata]|uniref:DUF4773 domain-containing protein n=1 Tax=Patiria miniata TaxID=46514 RepID=A0A914AYE4_PATMI|nr:uncharacterized protein LOC119738065 [Patiria miniata]